jgi:hypothetical protein
VGKFIVYGLLVIAASSMTNWLMLGRSAGLGGGGYGGGYYGGGSSSGSGHK